MPNKITHYTAFQSLHTRTHAHKTHTHTQIHIHSYMVHNIIVTIIQSNYGPLADPLLLIQTAPPNSDIKLTSL